LRVRAQTLDDLALFVDKLDVSSSPAIDSVLAGSDKKVEVMLLVEFLYLLWRQTGTEKLLSSLLGFLPLSLSLFVFLLALLFV
jgi:hypothetical protein